MSLVKIGNRNAATAAPSSSVAEIARLMEETSVGSVVILQQQKPIGIVTDRDLVLRVMRRGLDPAKLPVSEVMSRDPLCVSDDLDVTEAASRMRARQVRRLPI